MSEDVDMDGVREIYNHLYFDPLSSKKSNKLKNSCIWRSREDSFICHQKQLLRHEGLADFWM